MILDETAARRLYDDGLKDQRTDMALANQLNQQIRGRQKFLEGLTDMFPQIVSEPTQGRLPEVVERSLTTSPAQPIDPRGKAAARAVLLLRPGVWATVKAVTQELLNRGWISPESNDPEAAARQSLYRLADDDPTIERETMNGVLAFRYRPESPNGEARDLRELVGDA